MSIHFWVKRAAHLNGEVALPSGGMIAGSAASQLFMRPIGLFLLGAVSEGR